MFHLGSLMDDMFSDDFSPFRVHNRAMQNMNTMLNSMFVDPFAGMHGAEEYGFPSLMAAPAQHRPAQTVSQHSIMPFASGYGFPGMGSMFMNMDNGNSQAYASSTVMSMTTGPDGRPQVYQASNSVRTGPNGIRETCKTVSDSQSGVKRMAIGRHINERAHIVEREKNVRTGDEEEKQEYINIDEEESESFNREWQQRADRRYQHAAIAAGPSTSRRAHSYDAPVRAHPLAIAGPSNGEYEERRVDPRKAASKKLKRLKSAKK